MAYDYPTSINMTGTNAFTNIFNYLNTVTNDWFSNMLLIGIYILVAMGFYKATEDFSGALAVAGFALFVIGLLLWAAGIIDAIVFSAVIGIMVLSILFLLIDNKN